MSEQTYKASFQRITFIIEIFEMKFYDLAQTNRCNNDNRVAALIIDNSKAAMLTSAEKTFSELVTKATALEMSSLISASNLK